MNDQWQACRFCGGILFDHEEDPDPECRICDTCVERGRGNSTVYTPEAFQQPVKRRRRVP